MTDLDMKTEEEILAIVEKYQKEGKMARYCVFRW